MRLLVLHNRYRAPGGEERAAGEIVALMRRRGHHVDVFERDSSAAGSLRAARALVRGGEAEAEVADAISQTRPDVVHAHNVHPLFGWRALAVARAEGVRTVLHLHNFRLYCATGVAFRDGGPCHACTGIDTLPGLIRNCRGSWPQAGAYAAGLALGQRRLLAAAQELVALSAVQERLLRAHGLRHPRVSVIPNFIAAGECAAGSAAADGRYALTVGRLVPEKGFDVAIAAARAAGVPLRIAGAGPDERRLRALASGADVEFTGWLEPDRLAQERAGAAMVLVPSLWEEVCPFAVLDAMAAGVPVIASDRGGLPELLRLGTGRVAAACDVGAWSAAISDLWADREGRRSSGEAALQRVREVYGEDRAYAGLCAVYGWPC